MENVEDKDLVAGELPRCTTCSEADVRVFKLGLSARNAPKAVKSQKRAAKKASKRKEPEPEEDDQTESESISSDSDGDSA